MSKVDPPAGWAGAVAAALAGLATAAAPAFDRVLVGSPGARVRVELYVADGRLSYEVSHAGVRKVEASRLGLLVNSADLGQGVTIGAVENYRVEEAGQRGEGARVTVSHRATRLRYGVDIRAYDEGAAFRIIVPGEGTRTVDGASTFHFPTGSKIPGGEWLDPPAIVRLPGDGGYAAIAETDVGSFPALRLQADGARTLRERLVHAASIDGRITTPWRVVLFGEDLETLARLLAAR